MNKDLVRALLEERQGYVKRGLPDRVKAVDDSLARLGYVVESATIEPATERAVKKKPSRKTK